MKRFGHLFEKICAFENLNRAARATLKGKLHKPNAAEFFLNLEKELFQLREELQAETYRPGAYHCFEIYEPKCRHICAAPIRDRVLHHALCNLLTPILERSFIHDSYACRVGKGTHRAVQRAQLFCRKKGFFLKTDVEKFFASMDHEVLKGMLCRKIKDAKLLRLMNRIIDHPVPGHETGRGLAIGNLTSQWWANLYLDALDHFIKDEMGVSCYIRYMDDLLLFAEGKAELHLLKSGISKFLRDRLLLELKESATFIAPVHQGIPFLGFRIYPGTIRLKNRNRARFFRKMRECEEACESGEMDGETFLRTTASLIGHVCHADTYRMRRKAFHDLG